MKIEISPLYFGKSRPPRWPPRKVAASYSSARGERRGVVGVFIERIAQGTVDEN